MYNKKFVFSDLQFEIGLIMDNFQNKYFFIYSIMALLAIIFAIETTLKGKEWEKIQNNFVVVFSIVFIFFFGLRNENIGADTRNYLLAFDKMETMQTLQAIKDPGFNFFILFIKKIYDNGHFFLFCMSAIYLLSICTVVLYLPIKNKFLLFFVFVSFFFFESLGINIVRQGIAIALFVLAITKEDNNQKKQILLFVLGTMFHASVIIAVIFYFISKRLNNVTIPFFFLVISAILSFKGVNLSDVLASLPFGRNLIESRMDKYVNINQFEKYRIGFRVDFFIFNLFFAGIGYHFYKNKLLMELFPKYKRYFFSYLFLSGYFFLMFNARYSDRFGVLSWVFLPLILMPLLDNTEIMKKGAFKLIGVGVSIFIVFNLILR